MKTNRTEAVTYPKLAEQSKPLPGVGKRLRTQRASDVAVRSVSWLWRGRFTVGYVNILGGNPGVGKSMATCDFAARVTRGQDWPDGAPNELGSVLMMALEDSPDDAIVPRLMAAGADLDRIHFVEGVEAASKPDVAARLFDLSRDISLLEKEVARHGDVRLVILDPLTAYLGEKVDSWKETDVRRALAPLGVFARKYRLAVLACMHFRKAQTDAALSRLMGSGAFGAFVRAAWMLFPDRERLPDGRVMVMGKVSLGKAAPGLRFVIEDPGRVVWRGTTNQTAEDMMQPEKPRRRGDDSKVQVAVEWLRDVLADGPKPALDIRREAKEMSISDRTLDRAKQQLDVIAGNGDQFGKPWFWRLPDAKEVAE